MTSFFVSHNEGVSSGTRVGKQAAACFGADAHVEEELRFVDEVEGEAMAWGAEPLDGCLT